MKRRITLSKKVMGWLCYIVKEASTDQMNLVRQWRIKEIMIEFYGTIKVNEHGRYMSIISLKGESIDVIIEPKLAINVGWRDIAFKIEKFINGNTMPIAKHLPKMINRDIKFSKVVKDSKWKP